MLVVRVHFKVAELTLQTYHVVCNWAFHGCLHQQELKSYSLLAIREATGGMIEQA